MQDHQTVTQKEPRPTHIERFCYFDKSFDETPMLVMLYSNDLKKAPRGFRIFKLIIPVPPQEDWEISEEGPRPIHTILEQTEI